MGPHRQGAHGSMTADHLRKLVRVGLMSGLAAISLAELASQERAAREWRYYGADHAFTRYAPFDQITRDNVKGVTIAWTRPAVNPALTNAFPDLKVNAYLK